MRILTFCTSTNVFGAEVVTLKTLEGFKDSGHAQLAVTTIWTDGEFNRRLASIGIPEVRLPFGAFSKRLALQPLWWTANTLVRLPVFWRGLRRVLREFKPDVILWTSSRIPMLAYPVLDDTPSFLIEFSYLEPTETRRAMYALLTRKITGFIAVSDFMGKHVRHFGVPARQIHVIKSGAFSEADLSRIAADETIALRSTTDPFKVGIVGQISPDKGHRCLVEAVRLLKQSDRKFEVHVFGSGNPEYVRDVKQRVEAGGLASHFHWRGYQRKKADIYGGINVCVVPSSFGDPFPTVAMEAGAYRLPVVASRVGGLPEIVENGVTGWLVEPNSPQELAEKIDWLLSNRAAADKMGGAGQKRVREKFTQERMITAFEVLFRASGISTNVQTAAAPIKT